MTNDEMQAKLVELARERDDLKTELARLSETRKRGCDCADDEACVFVRERDEARVRVAELEADIEAGFETCRRHDTAPRSVKGGSVSQLIGFLSHSLLGRRFALEDLMAACERLKARVTELEEAHDEQRARADSLDATVNGMSERLEELEDEPSCTVKFNGGDLMLVWQGSGSMRVADLKLRENDALRSEVQRLKEEVARAREEQREACARPWDAGDLASRHIAAAIRATPLDATPLADANAKLREALGELLGVGHNLKAFAGSMLRWNEPGVDWSDEAKRIVELAERNHRIICAALDATKEGP